MSTFPQYSKRAKQKGVTLIELIVVIAIVGSIMTLGLKLLKSFWLKQSTGTTSLEMMQLFEVGREKALSKGIIYSLSINTDKKIMELTVYNPEVERNLSGAETFEKKSDDDEKKAKPKVLFSSNLPPQISEFRSPSGIKITAPVFYIHFYPDGTSDSLIIKYEDREKPYHFIPRNGGNGIFLTDLGILNHEN